MATSKRTILDATLTMVMSPRLAWVLFVKTLLVIVFLCAGPAIDRFVTALVLFKVLFEWE